MHYKALITIEDGEGTVIRDQLITVNEKQVGDTCIRSEFSMPITVRDGETLRVTPVQNLEQLLSLYRTNKIMATRTDVRRGIEIELQDLGELPSRCKEALMRIAVIAIMGVELEEQCEQGGCNCK